MLYPEYNGIMLTNLMFKFSGRESRVYQRYSFREREKKYSGDFSKVIKLVPFLMIPGSAKVEGLHLHDLHYTLKGICFPIEKAWHAAHSSSGCGM